MAHDLPIRVLISAAQSETAACQAGYFRGNTIRINALLLKESTIHFTALSMRPITFLSSSTAICHASVLS
jgi:hypothetical protein